MKKICLVGNPNCGKTSLFNMLTGTYQKVGNWSGVTTEKKVGVYRHNKEVQITDLPGIYSLEAHSKDERAVIDFLQDNPDNVIVNIVDGTNLIRNLVLSTKLISLGLPMIIAVNFIDVLQKNKINLNFKGLEELLGVKITPISALKGKGVIELVDYALTATKPEKSATDKFFNKTTEQLTQILSINLPNLINKRKIKSEKVTIRLDNFLLGKFTGIPFFVLVIITVYFLSSKIGGFFSVKISHFFSAFSLNTQRAMLNLNLPEWFINLFAKAVLGGVGSIISFTPQILVLFFLMSIMEESGYTARVTFLFDKLFRWFGLGGKSVISMVLSCGCTVTGIISTRTIESEREKKSTIFLSPFMPCGAKTAVFGWFSHTFFGGNPLISASMYFLGIISVIIFGLILKKISPSKWDNLPFIVEIPTLKFPNPRNIMMVLWEKTKDFLVKTGSTILAVSIVIWVLLNFGVKGYVGGQVEQSFLFNIGNLIKWIFMPLGFGSWQAAVSVIAGIFAKESVVESIILLSKDGFNMFANNFSIYAFMAFVLLSPPCMASIITAKRELNSYKDLFLMLAFQTICAYLVALCINLIGLSINTPLTLLLPIICGIIIVAWAVVVLIKHLKNPCKNCCKECKGRVCQPTIKRSTTI